MNFSNLNRPAFVQQLSSRPFDLLVVGGGITGCGIALDAALRGLKVGLVEKGDFAGGTSSRSTKLIHGGLRYLKQMEFKLVRDVGSERAVVHRNARHVVIAEKMLLPIVQEGSLGKLSTSLGLMVYDILAGVKRSERRKMLDRHQTLKAEPMLNADKLIGGGLYFEYRTDDSRLVIELAKSAFANGAVLLNYAELKNFVYDADKVITGANILDHATGQMLQVSATAVVNACGPWVDLLRKSDDSLKGKRLQLTKGVHIVFPHHKLPIRQAAYFDVADGRMIFAIPRNGITYVGTTDTVYNREIDNPRCSLQDAEYLLNAVNKTFKGVSLGVSDIVSSWAGLRPLIHEDGKSPSELSRKDEIMVSPSGLISIAGGKLTGYRLMAEKIVDLVEGRLKKGHKGCKTKDYRLSGGEFKSEDDFFALFETFLTQGRQLQVPDEVLHRWFFRYGKNAFSVLGNLRQLSANGAAVEYPFTEAEIKYCVDHEMVYHLNDLLIRRTGQIFFDRPNAQAHLPVIAAGIAAALNLPEATVAKMLRETKEEFEQVITFE